MKRFDLAMRILKTLNSKGHQAYIVGGAVRDFILGIELDDIDITTSAIPVDVMKIFTDTKPTGFQYGTITVYLGSKDFQVTTFRTEDVYDDNRHPSGVTYTTDVKADVKRRDFTINGLLMDQRGEIHDFVGGRDDLTNKIITTIGNPDERFSEDSLRMMRAFHFQSKLGFQISKETRDSIKRNRKDIPKIANERVLDELFKMFKGKYLSRAVQSLVTTKVSEVLPGLDKGIKYISELKELPLIQTFFSLSFYLYGSVPLEWRFSNQDRHFYNRIIELTPLCVKGFDNQLVYHYGMEYCIMANRLNELLKKSPDLKIEIINVFNKLPIKSELDLKLRAPEIIKLTNRKAGAWLKELQKELINLILDHKIKNEHNVLKEYVLKKEW